ncbi:MAG TPA: lipid-binding SYLF domain-containing protein [Geobacteraceae bacterium]
MKVRVQHIIKCGLRLFAGIFMVTALFGSYTAVYGAGKAEAQSIIDKSKGTISEMATNEAFSWLPAYLKTAKGVLIFPQVLKAGFILGGSGGTGVLLVHDAASGTWSEPAFYTVGSVTFGLQIGGEAAEVVMLVMNQKALDSLLTSSVKLGGDASVTVGPVGAGAKGAVTIPEVTADFVSFAKTKGLYAGLNLEGSVLAVRDTLNSDYYGKKVMPKDIIVKKDVSNSGANELRDALRKASAR